MTPAGLASGVGTTTPGHDRHSQYPNRAPHDLQAPDRTAPNRPAPNRQDSRQPHHTATAFPQRVSGQRGGSIIVPALVAFLHLAMVPLSMLGLLLGGIILAPFVALRPEVQGYPEPLARWLLSVRSYRRAHSYSQELFHTKQHCGAWARLRTHFWLCTFCLALLPVSFLEALDEILQPGDVHPEDAH